MKFIDQYRSPIEIALFYEGQVEYWNSAANPVIRQHIWNGWAICNEHDPFNPIKGVDPNKKVGLKQLEKDHPDDKTPYCSLFILSILYMFFDQFPKRSVYIPAFIKLMTEAGSHLIQPSSPFKKRKIMNNGIPGITAQAKSWVHFRHDTGRTNLNSAEHKRLSLKKAEYGDLVVYWRINPKLKTGHVGFYLSSDKKTGTINDFGGNVSDSIKKREGISDYQVIAICKMNYILPMVMKDDFYKFLVKKRHT